MQTNFTKAQLTDPDTCAAEQVLRKCVHCGFCNATCPTYVLLGDELDGPRGRIYLIKDMLENDRPASAPVVTHLDRCLSCLACMTTCPSGVHYQHLIDHARVHVERTYRRPWPERALRALLAAVLPYPGRLRAALSVAAGLRGASRLLPAPWRARVLESLPLSVQALWRLAKVPAAQAAVAAPRVVAVSAPAVSSPAATAASAAAGATASAAAAVSAGAAASASIPASASVAVRGRVALILGCAQSVLTPEVHTATVRVLRRAGLEVVPVSGCCGALTHHLGRQPASHQFAATLIQRLAAVHAEGALQAIVVNASGCGTQLKDYGFMLRNDAKLAADAAWVSSLSRDIVEVLADCAPRAPVAGPGPASTPEPLPVVAYQSACSMQHGQGLDALPRRLLAQAGFTVREIPESHLCCGSAGTYNILQPQLAQALRDRKLANIARTGATVIASGNVGCMTQLRTAAALPVVHTVELLDWASGGPRPAALGAVGAKLALRQFGGT